MFSPFFSYFAETVSQSDWSPRLKWSSWTVNTEGGGGGEITNAATEKITHGAIHTRVKRLFKFQTFDPQIEQLCINLGGKGMSTF